MSNLTFASTISFWQFIYETVRLRMKWTKKHQNLTSASDNSVFRSSWGENSKKCWVWHRRPMWAKTKTPQTTWEKSSVSGKLISQKNQQVRLQRIFEQKKSKALTWDSWTVWAETSRNKDGEVNMFPLHIPVRTWHFIITHCDREWAEFWKQNKKQKRHG